MDLLKQTERFGLHFWSVKDREKGMMNVFSRKKLTSELCVCIFGWNCNKIGSLAVFSNDNEKKRRNNAFGSKQAPKNVPPLFLKVKMVGERFD